MSANAARDFGLQAVLVDLFQQILSHIRKIISLEIGNGQEKNALQLAERSGRQQGSSRMGCKVRRRDGRRGRAERRHV